jgi:hypothetical protein
MDFFKEKFVSFSVLFFFQSPNRKYKYKVENETKIEINFYYNFLTKFSPFFLQNSTQKCFYSLNPNLIVPPKIRQLLKSNLYTVKLAFSLIFDN